LPMSTVESWAALIRRAIRLAVHPGPRSLDQSTLSSFQTPGRPLIGTRRRRDSSWRPRSGEAGLAENALSCLVTTTLMAKAPSTNAHPWAVEACWACTHGLRKLRRHRVRPADRCRCPLSMTASPAGIDSFAPRAQVIQHRIDAARSREGADFPKCRLRSVRTSPPGSLRPLLGSSADEPASQPHQGLAGELRVGNSIPPECA